MTHDWDEPGLKVEDHGPITRLILSRPHAMNAYSPGLVRALNQALDAFVCDARKRVLVVSGSGRAFCCGADLKFLAAHPGDGPQVRDFLLGLNRFIDALDGLDRPVIASVNGPAMGGGLETMLVCDIVVAAQNATISDPHITIAAVHGAGGSQRLARSVGMQRALDLVLTARRLSAREAADWGLIARVVADADLEEETLSLARTLAARDGEVACALKRLVRLSMSASLNEGLACEREAYRAASLRPPFQEAMAAFARKAAASPSDDSSRKSQ